MEYSLFLLLIFLLRLEEKGKKSTKTNKDTSFSVPEENEPLHKFTEDTKKNKSTGEFCSN